MEEDGAVLVEEVPVDLDVVDFNSNPVQKLRIGPRMKAKVLTELVFLMCVHTVLDSVFAKFRKIRHNFAKNKALFCK